MRVLFCSTGGLGHLLPMRPLARMLHQRGHAVAWVTAPDAGSALQPEAFTLFAAGPSFEASRRELRTAHPDVVRLTGEALSAYTFPRLFGAVLAPAMLEGIERAAQAWQPDLVVGEAAALAAPLVCRQLGIPHATHGYGLRPPLEYVVEAMNFFGPSWRSRGLDVPADGGLHRHLDLDIAPPSLQASTGCRPGGIRYNAQGPVPASLPAGLDAALRHSCARRPRIYVTFGSVFNHRPLLRVAAQAAAGLGGTVVVTVGPDGDPSVLAEFGARVHVHRFVDQAAVLPHCDAVVSHGGAGVMLGAAAHGVPHLVLPQAADHFRNARALERVPAGAAVEPVDPSAETVGRALSTLLGCRAAVAGARLLADEMAAMPDAAALAALLEGWHARAALDAA